MDVTATPTDASRPLDAGKTARGLAVWAVLGSGVVALFLGSAAIWLVREQLHIRCSMGQPGSEGANTWTCSDGIGYLGVAVVLGAMWFLAILFGALVAGLVRHDRAARVVLVVLAATSAAWILALTRYGASELVDDIYAPMRGEEYWQHAVGPAAIASCIGLTAALVSLFFGGRLAVIVIAGAAVGLVVATVLQPGLSINSVPAAGLLAAAAIRATAPARPQQP
jgi:hypothetical protein